jgi:glycosyltransferase involved in cell wall biosynthesis
MRLLWVKAGKLLPVDTGGKIRSYNLLRHLASRNDVTLLSYYSGAPDDAYDEAIRAEFPRAVPVATGGPGGSGVGVALDYARHLCSPAPYAVTKFTSPRVRHLIRSWFEERRFDAAVCDFLSASLNVPRTQTTPCVLFQHNVESVLWRRQAAHEPNIVKRVAFTLEAAKMARYERAAVRRFPHVIAVSSRDRDEMTRMVDAARISVVPTGVDVSQYRAAASTPAEQPVLLFLGSMDWEANVDAVDYFCRDIWPAIAAAVPSARFRIVGRNPHSRVQRLASDRVEVTGRVPSVLDHLRDAAVFVVPLRIGGGTRLKIFEAMAAGKAVVSTSVGAEGLDVHDGRDIVLADTAPLFADAVIGLLRDRERRRRFEIAAGDLAAQYDWSVVARQFERVLAEVSRLTPPEQQASLGVAPIAS